MDKDKMYQDLMPILLNLEGIHESRPSSRLKDTIERLSLVIHRVTNVDNYYNS